MTPRKYLILSSAACFSWSDSTSPVKVTVPFSTITFKACGVTPFFQVQAKFHASGDFDVVVAFMAGRNHPQLNRQRFDASDCLDSFLNAEFVRMTSNVVTQLDNAAPY